MDKKLIAKNIENLAKWLSISTKEVWESHTDESIKEKYSYDEISELFERIHW